MKLLFAAAKKGTEMCPFLSHARTRFAICRIVRHGAIEKRSAQAAIPVRCAPASALSREAGERHFLAMAHERGNTMNRLLIGWAAAAVAAVPLCGQSMADMDVQVHGYAAQGFLYTTHNNVFYSNSSNGSPAWTEAVVNVTVQPNDKLRVGVQARYQLLGDSGNTITMDWAAADYRVNDHLGVRFGKVKTPWGLFNETQDLDPTYMWALLPQSVYDIATRNADLAHFGGVVYGSWDLGESVGKAEYRFWGGEQVIPTNDGQFDDLNATGNGPTGDFVYPVFGGALHWKTPLNGLMIGASDSRAERASASLEGGSENFAAWNNLSYFGQYTWKKLMAAGEWNRQASPGTLNLSDEETSSISTDARGWYGMAAYKLTGKLSLGAYNSQFFDVDSPLSPDRFTKDWTISGRYDVNEFIYIKAEEHFIDGTALSLDNLHNTTLVPRYNLTALRVGVSF